MRFLVPLLLTASACIDVTLPGPPGPGSLQGTLVYYRPGRATPVQAAGAKVSLRRTSLSTTTNADGLFVLEPIRQTSGELLMTLDLDADGRPDRQRVLALDGLKAGPGRDVSLGQVTLGLNASAVGTVLRGDVATRGGHGGTSVLVPEGPYATTTSDDGSYLLPDLPEGPLTVAFFREGYGLVVVETSARAGEEVRLQQVRLERSTGTTSGTITGRVVLAEGGPATDAVVSLARQGVVAREVMVEADGAFAFEALMAGPWDVAARRPGRVTALLRNVLVAEGTTNVGELVLSEGLSTPPDFAPLPGLDGGTQTADAGTGDGGATDGGTGDAGTGDAGVPGDAGAIDAGPVARISPAVVPVVIDTALDGGIVSFVVNGDLSTGAAPLRYQWESLNVGDGLYWTMTNEFASRAEFTFAAGVSVRTYRIRLQVTDTRGQSSAPVEAEVRAAYRPIAALTPATAQAGGSVVLSSAGSVDPGGLPLTHRFFVISGLATLAFGGTQVTVTALAPGPVVVACEVENSFGLVSARVTSTIDFAAAGDAGVQVDAGPNQVVDAGALVTLSGSVLGSAPFSVAWTEVPPGSPPVALTGADTLTPTFLAPEAVGGNEVRRFQMEVRQPPNCTASSPACQRTAAETSVEIIDRSGPRANFSVGPAVQLSRFRSVVVDFNEPPAVNPVFTMSSASVNVATTTVQETPRRFRVIPREPLAANVPGEVSVSAVTDSRGNTTPAQSVQFSTRQPVVTAVTGPTLSTTPNAPRVGATVVPARPLGPAVPTLVVAARVDDSANQVVLMRPMPVSQPLAPQIDTSAPTVTGLAGSVFSRRLLTVGSTAWAALDTNTGNWSGTVTDGALFSTDLAAASPRWVRHQQQGTPPPTGAWTTSLPGPVFTDGASLFTIAPTVAQGVRVARFQEPSGWPDVATGAPAEDFRMLSLQPGLVRAVGFNQLGVRAIAFFEEAPRTLVIARSTGIGTPWAFSNSTITFPMGSVPKAMRFVVSGATPGVQWVASNPDTAGSPVLRIDAQTVGTTFGSVPLPVLPPTPSFDLAVSPAGQHFYLAAVSSGELFLWRRLAVGTAWSLVDGVNGNQSFQSIGCTPANPELALTEDSGFFMAWTESCGPGFWNLRLVRID
ncbi:MAG: carboxypeptidase regulatory-like domain-containing protein [Myxococcaceae bacterium]|nr:carboxypeptidase regulatory-like domain-containing protein [Myxococcaceae bacterium]